MDNSLEFRIEQIKNFGNLKFQLLESVYIHDGRSIGELYMNGEATLHIHGFIGEYRFCATLRNGINDRGFGYGKLPVFVWIGQVSECPRPLASAIWLKPLNHCDMLVTKTFDIMTMPSPEDLFTILNGKLSKLLDRVGVVVCQFIDEIVKGCSQVIGNFTYKDFNDVGNRFNREGGLAPNPVDLTTIWQSEGCWIAINNNVITYSLAENINPAIQIRQVYACPFNPLISAIQRLHMLYYPKGDNDGEKETKYSQGARDTRAHKRRVRAQSKEGCKTEQVNAPKPEEVEFQISPSNVLFS